MQLSAAIAERRAVREYTVEPITRSIIQQLIDEAVYAPSARNQQPWSFAVVLDGRRVESLAQQAKQWLLANHDSIPEGLNEALKNPGFSLFYHAPALILVMATDASTQADEDSCLVAQNLMLLARDQNIGSCWIGLSRPWFNLDTTKRELHLPQHVHIVAPIILGHPAAWPAAHGRKPADIHWLD